VTVSWELEEIHRCTGRYRVVLDADMHANWRWHLAGAVDGWTDGRRPHDAEPFISIDASDARDLSM